MEDKYSLEAVKELIAWFKDKEIPESMYLDESAYAPDLRLTIEILSEQSLQLHENPTFHPVVDQLYHIKTKLEAMN